MVADVVVVLGVVVEVVVGVADAAEATDEVPVDDWPDTVVAGVEAVDAEEVAVDPEVDVPVVAAVTDDAWVVAPEATTRPRAAAAAEAATPMVTVARRTRAIARSRERAAEYGSFRLIRDRGAMADLSRLGRWTDRVCSTDVPLL